MSQNACARAHTHTHTHTARIDQVPLAQTHGRTKPPHISQFIPLVARKGSECLSDAGDKTEKGEEGLSSSTQTPSAGKDPQAHPLHADALHPCRGQPWTKVPESLRLPAVSLKTHQQDTEERPLAKNLMGSFSLLSAQLQRDNLESPSLVWQGGRGLGVERERRGETRAARRAGRWPLCD